jgi:signal transduction histidine kinase
MSQGACLSNSKGAAEPEGHQRLADFIRQNEAAIVDEWTEFAGTRSPASNKMSKLALEDHIVPILRFVADDLESPQTPREQFDKSRGKGPEDGPFFESAAEIHAALRLADGFDIDQMASEYRALRASVVKQWVAHQPSLASSDLEDLTRFNEAIDQAVKESVAHYTKTINDSRNLFLGVLGHDLRNPIAAASMAAQWMERAGTKDPKQAKVVSELIQTTDRATRFLNDLLDLTRSTFGTDIPVAKSQTDMAALCHEIANELRTINVDRRVDITLEGDPIGSWDRARMGQVLSNLMSNAIQYSDASSPVTVTVTGTDPETVTVSVHNLGTPIPPKKQQIIFQSWVRGQEVNEHGSHLGLGLYIARLIVEAHGGEIGVTSDHESGTTFFLQLPRT